MTVLFFALVIGGTASALAAGFIWFTAPRPEPTYRDGLHALARITDRLSESTERNASRGRARTSRLRSAS